MQLIEPKKPTWIVSAVIALLALISEFVPIPYVSRYSFWALLIAYLVLAMGTFETFYPEYNDDEIEK